ncbi:T/G mismatch-specific endonuclease [Klenkia marina]|uniref:T/G mismatch-specific endonuclease n=2 Tax=Klenkia marina TaxID=1960309 RepID=A0A1G4YUC0_9ACTN|nr:T/G mismatch-specific endonuclease [Klenkia marina]
MQRTRKRDNGPEMAVRQRLHAEGLRYRVAYRVPGQRRRSIDIAFTRVRLAVFIDGCFWHACPEHLHFPRANAAWWVTKLETNQLRDLSVTAQLKGLGWTVLRFWEHEDPNAVVAAIADAVERMHCRRGPV